MVCIAEPKECMPKKSCFLLCVCEWYIIHQCRHFESAGGRFLVAFNMRTTNSTR